MTADPADGRAGPGAPVRAVSPLRAGALIVFGRLPRPGRVKSRLARDVGASLACAIYAELMARTFAAGEACPPSIRRHFDYDGDPTADADDLSSWLASVAARRWIVSAQRGEGLGERMRRSLDAALATTEAAVLVGTDGATTDPAYLGLAFDALATSDCVLGPTRDGGYLLIGTRRPLPTSVFEQAWSTPTVLDGTRTALARAGLGWRELPTVDDIDTAADLAAIAPVMPDSIAVALRTAGPR